MSNTMEIKEGKFYLTRDGRIAKVIANDVDQDYPLWGKILQGKNCFFTCWTKDGKGFPPGEDLVE